MLNKILNKKTKQNPDNKIKRIVKAPREGTKWRQQVCFFMKKQPMRNLELRWYVADTVLHRYRRENR